MKNTRLALALLTTGFLVGSSFATPGGEGSGTGSFSGLNISHDQETASESTSGSTSSGGSSPSGTSASSSTSAQFGGSGTCGPIAISNCVVKPAQGKNTAAYGVVKQNSGHPDVLVSASTPFADKTEIHDMAMEGGVMKMQHVKNGIQIPANGQISFQPGGKHIMLIGVKAGFESQKEIPITLNFKQAGPTEVKFTIDPEAAKKFENVSGTSGSGSSSPSGSSSGGSAYTSTGSGTSSTPGHTASTGSEGTGKEGHGTH